MALGLEIFATWQFVVLCLTIWIATYVIRTVVDNFWKTAGLSRLWTKLALPMMPLAIGAIIGSVARKFPWPEQLGQSYSARLMFALICGLFCGWMYAKVRDGLKPTETLPVNTVVPEPPADNTPELPKG